MECKVAGAQITIKNEIVFGKINNFINWMSTLSRYKRIYIMANSPTARNEPLCTDCQDLLIVFNYFDREKVEQHRGDVVVINRQSTDQPLFHGHYNRLQGEEGQIRYFALSDFYRYVDIDNVDFLSGYEAIICADFIPYAARTATYASSGFVLLYLLNYYLSLNTAPPVVHLLGFQFSGYGTHDWQYEKQQAEQFFLLQRGVK